MAKAFDATLKALLEESPSDWPVLVGKPAKEVDVIDADIATISGAADKVLRVHDTPDWILHIDFQAGPDASLPRRVHVYNALLGHRHQLRVRSVAVLLRPEANLANLSGVYVEQFEGEPEYLRFCYQVIRLWELPVEPFLRGGPGILPLAPISAVTEAELPGVIAQLKSRLRGQRHGDRAGRLWTAAKVLMGLRYSAELVDHLLKGITEMEESVTYQAIKAEGRAEELRRMILLLGRERFGKPDARVRALLRSVTAVDELETLALRLVKVERWQDLLERPRARKVRKNS